MGRLSSSRKAAVTFKVAGGLLGRSRWVQAGRTAASGMFNTASRAGRLLFLQTSGLIFAAFALAGLGAIAKEWNAYSAAGEQAEAGRVVLAAGFTLLFGYFAVSSFWKARVRR